MNLDPPDIYERARRWLIDVGTLLVLLVGVTVVAGVVIVLLGILRFLVRHVLL